MSSEAHAINGVPPSTTDTLQQWREQAFQIILYVVFFFNLISTPSIVYNAWGDNRLDLVILYISTFVIVTAVTFIRRIWFSVRASVLLVLCYAPGVVDLVNYGMGGEGRLMLFTFIILATLFFGVWGAVISVAVCIMTLIWFSLALANGQIVIDPAIADHVTNPELLVSGGIIFIFLVAVVISLMLSLIRQLTWSMRASEQAMREAIEARQQAEHQSATLEQQTATLEQQTATLTHTEQQLRDLISTLETPTVPLAHGILLAPIVGAVDSHRAQNLMERLLTEAQNQQTSTVVLDIAGVATVDTQVAQALLQTAQALRLLGCQVILTGVSPHVANTLTQLGMDMKAIRTARSPQELLETGGNTIHRRR